MEPAAGERLFPRPGKRSRRRFLQSAAALGVGSVAGIDGTGRASASGGDELWRFQAGERILSSPTVVEDTVFIGSDDSNIYALDAATGTPRWKFYTNSAVESSPTVTDGTLFVGGHNSTVYAFDAGTGDIIWQYDSGGAVISSPTVVDGSVYFANMAGSVFSIDASTGIHNWDVQPTDELTPSPTVLDGTVYLAEYALEADSGEPVWTVDTPSTASSSATVANGTVFFGNRVSTDGNVFAVDANSGEIQWQLSFDSPTTSTPTVQDGSVYTGFEDSRVRAFDAATGQELWTFAAGREVRSSPTIANGTVFVGSLDGNVYALDGDTGQEVWHWQTPSYGVYSSPTVREGTVYVAGWDDSGDAHYVYALDAGVSGSSEGSRVRLGTLGHHESVIESISIYVPAFFEVTYLYDNSPDPGEELVVGFQVKNTGDREGTKAAALRIDGERVAETQAYTIEPNHRELTELQYAVPDDAGGESLSVEIVTEDHAVEESVYIPQAASFRIANVETNGPVEAGEDVEVTVDVENVGDYAGTQTVALSKQGIEVATVSIELAGGETTTETLAFESTGDEVGDATVRVSSDDDSQTLSIGVSEAGGAGNQGEPADGEDGGGTGIGTTEIAALGGGGGLLALLGGYALLRRSSDDDEYSPPSDGTGAAAADDSSEPPGPPGASGATGTATESGDSGSGTGHAAHVGSDDGTASPSAASGEPAGDGSQGATPAGASPVAGAATADEADLDIEERLGKIEALLADARNKRDANEYGDALAQTDRATEAAETLREEATVGAPDRVSEIEPVLGDARDLDAALGTERDDYREAWTRYQDLSNTYDELAAQADPTEPDEQLERLAGLRTKLERVEELVANHEFENLAQRVDTLEQNCTDLAGELESGHATIRDARSTLDTLEAALDDAEATLEAGEYGATIQQLDDVEGEMAQTRGLVEDYETPAIDTRLEDLRIRWEDLRERATEARGPTTGEPDEIPTVPRLHLDYSDIQRIEAIGTGGNADVYRARVPTPDDGPLDVAVKEPRMGGLLLGETVHEVPGGTDPTLNPDAFEQPEQSTTALEESGMEHVPGESGTRTWSRDEDLDPDAMDPDYQPGAPTTDPDGSPAEIQPGEEAESTAADTRRNDDDDIQLLEEAEKWEKLDDHDHIVNIVDYGDNPLPWIAMEYMDGGHIAHRAGDVDMDQALWIAIATTKAVRHAHRRGIAHLDLKPDNILFRTVDDAWDVPKVADWGLSKLLLNHSQSVAGLSTHYAAPEQFDREFGQADDITDIYQLGAVFYELFTGQRPFEGRPAQVMRKVLTADVTPPTEIADVPAELDDILLKALAREKTDRYETVVNLRNDLQNVRSSL